GTYRRQPGVEIFSREFRVWLARSDWKFRPPQISWDDQSTELPTSFEGDLHGKADGHRIAVGILGRLKDPRSDAFQGGFVEYRIERFRHAHLGGISFERHENRQNNIPVATWTALSRRPIGRRA